MSDERLGLIQELLRLRGRIFDREGESEDYFILSRAIDALKAKEGEREPIHTT